MGGAWPWASDPGPGTVAAPVTPRCPPPPDSSVGLHGPRTVGAACGLLCIPGTLHRELWGTHSGRKGCSSVRHQEAFLSGRLSCWPRQEHRAGREATAGSPSSAEGREAMSPGGCALGSRPRGETGPQGTGARAPGLGWRGLPTGPGGHPACPQPAWRLTHGGAERRGAGSIVLPHENSATVKHRPSHIKLFDK